MNTSFVSRDTWPRLVVWVFFFSCSALGIAIVLALLTKAWKISLISSLLKVGSDEKLLSALKNTLILFLLSLFVQFLAVFMATMYIRKIPKYLEVLLILPFAAGLIAPSFSLFVFLSSALGPMNLGILGNPIGARAIIVLIDTWQWVGIILLVSFIRLKSVSLDQYDQARLEGISRFRCWLFLTWPSIRYVFVLYSAVRAIDWLRKVDSIKAIFGEGGPGYACETLGLYISKLYFQPDPDPFYAAFLTILQIIILGIGVTLLTIMPGFRRLTGEEN